MSPGDESGMAGVCPLPWSVLVPGEGGHILPKGGLGNLIALPLQFAPRKVGNSVFIDSEFNPFPDQWQFLSTIRRMPANDAEEIVAGCHHGSRKSPAGKTSRSGGSRSSSYVLLPTDSPI
jgi:hypothetical protein